MVDRPQVLGKAWYGVCHDTILLKARGKLVLYSSMVPVPQCDNFTGTKWDGGIHVAFILS